MARRSSIEIHVTSPTACIVSLRGTRDASSRLAVALRLAAVGGYRNVLVDLSDCAVGDGALAAALRRAAGRMRQDDGALELVVPARATALRSALERARLQRLLPFHETRAAGVASMAAAEGIAAHREAASLTTVSARIDQLEARTESGRARALARTRPGVTVVSAQILAGPPWLAEPAGEGGARLA